MNTPSVAMPESPKTWKVNTVAIDVCCSKLKSRVKKGCKCKQVNLNKNQF